MSTMKDHSRAVRYRKLALAQSDKGTADLLNGLAEESERGTLCTTDNMRQQAISPLESDAP